MDKHFGILIGAGFVTRSLFEQWVESKLKEAKAASKKEVANWKPVGAKPPGGERLRDD